MTAELIQQAAPVSRYERHEIVQAIKQTVCKGASDAQLIMFLEVCKKTGLDPFLKEIWFVPSVGVMAGRDGYLRVANDNPQFDGMETRVERDETGKPIKATCSVWRKDRTHPITCEAYYSEYKKSSPIWQQYPSAMISKVAEVLALKRSFSINGVVTEEEIGNPGPAIVPPVQSEPITMEEADAIRDLLADCGASPVDPKFVAWLKKHFGVELISEIQQHQFKQIMQVLQDRRARG